MTECGTPTGYAPRTVRRGEYPPDRRAAARPRATRHLPPPATRPVYSSCRCAEPGERINPRARKRQCQKMNNGSAHGKNGCAASPISASLAPGLIHVGSGSRYTSFQSTNAGALDRIAAHRGSQSLTISSTADFSPGKDQDSLMSASSLQKQQSENGVRERWVR